MATRTILREGDPSLLKKSRVVTDFNARLHMLIDDMRETLIEANGLGLAAPQVGVLRRVALIVDMDNESEEFGEKIIELINPEIMAKSGEKEGSEGCLSVPGLYGMVKRPELVRFKAQDRFGTPFELWIKNLGARAVCHEVDHLDGVMFTTLAERYLTEEELEAMEAEREAQENEDKSELDENEQQAREDEGMSGREDEGGGVV